LVVLLNIGDEQQEFSVEGFARLNLVLGSDDVDAAAVSDGVVAAHGWAIVQSA
jgi:hypothetical protein